MKFNQIVTILMYFVLLLSCKKSDIQHEDAFDKSYKTWLSFKRNNQNSYRYSVVSGSWVGISSQTIITVTDGRITERYFKRTVPKDYHIPSEELEWTEKENEINTKTNTPAAAPLTLDEIYHKAKTKWLIKRDNAKIYFEAENNGLISLSGYVENG